MASSRAMVLSAKLHAFSADHKATTLKTTISTFSSSFPSSIIPVTTLALSNAMKTTRSCITKMRRQVHNSTNWEQMVHPSLDPLLRQEIIRYGDLVIACYKTFDLDPTSKRHLNCKYGKKTMMEEVGLGNLGYNVTKYIYATPDVGISTSCESRWIGYVAASSDDEVRRLGRRDLVITFRGTVTYNEWLVNFMSSLTPARFNPNHPRKEVKVEAGFLCLYTSSEKVGKFGLQSCREQLLAEISRLLNKYKGEELSITVAGHSMGSSLALLLAYDIAELELNKDVPIKVFSFAGPRVGNLAFKDRLDELGVKVLRIVNVNDPITRFPGFFLNENFRFLHDHSSSCYAHVGTELALDFFNMENPSCVHDLESHIRLLRSPKVEIDNVTSRYEDDDHDDNMLFHDRAKQVLLSAQNLAQFGVGLDQCLSLFQILLLVGGICIYVCIFDHS
ncbi:phospholipase A1-Ialpha2, chloroplastic-like [Impatiens glandulifera]|uniref:phospholipase A1-Ialpha2, chloroplastic-like n=1 Tax=Impatiens glandulifera TaxID=253017 RepID=UPI001FB06F04|nr:phospholipase A1-Ialpha2, chloroplastic-like [Impatiens glandulifera]